MSGGAQRLNWAKKSMDTNVSGIVGSHDFSGHKRDHLSNQGEYGQNEQSNIMVKGGDKSGQQSSVA